MVLIYKIRQNITILWLLFFILCYLCATALLSSHHFTPSTKCDFQCVNVPFTAIHSHSNDLLRCRRRCRRHCWHTHTHKEKKMELTEEWRYICGWLWIRRSVSRRRQFLNVCFYKCCFVKDKKISYYYYCVSSHFTTLLWQHFNVLEETERERKNESKMTPSYRIANICVYIGASKWQWQTNSMQRAFDPSALHIIIIHIHTYIYEYTYVYILM